MKTKQEKVSKVYKNEHDNVNTERQLIPTEYRKVFWTLIASQKKFDKVFDKLIAAIDNAKEVKELVH